LVKKAAGVVVDDDWLPYKQVKALNPDAIYLSIDKKIGEVRSQAFCALNLES